MASPTKSGIPLSVINPQFLHTNSTSHKWPFSAVAELIDNAYDPDVNAKQLWITKTAVKGQDCLIFMDNGNGIDYDKMHKMLSFGFSDKQAVRGHVPIGLYGNGFKSGSMRLGKDAIVFSKKANIMCVGLLSQTYLKKTGVTTVIVPIVMFTKTRQRVGATPEHAESLNDIMTYSLFNTEEELLSEFTVIENLCTNSSGTRIIIWNLHRGSSGELEFDFKKDPYDIRIPVDVYESTRAQTRRQAGSCISVPKSEYSLRAYCSILYLKPRMQIIIQGQKVETQFVTKILANVFTDKYKPAGLKKGITITFGYNTKSKDHYGLMMYNKNRLIKAYERVACQRKANGTGEGVIGVLECNHLTPIHNKQDFDNNEEYRKTMISVGMKLEQYWKEVHYRHKTRSDEPFEDTLSTPDQTWVQCDDCLKWRKLPDCMYGKKTPKNWFCHMNADPQFRSCTDEEELEDSDDEQPKSWKTYKKHERTQKRQQENRQQSPVTPRPSDTSAVILDTSLSTTPKRKNKALDIIQEKSEKKLRTKGFDKIIPDSPTMMSPASGSNTADCKDLKTALDDVIFVSTSDEKSIQFTKSSSGDQQIDKGQYLKQLEDKLRKLIKLLKTEKVDTKIDSLEYEKWTNSCESLQKCLEESKIKREKVEVTTEDCVAPSREASNPGRGKDSQWIRKNQTQDRSERFTELRKRMTRILATFVPVQDLEKVIDQILTQDIDEMSSTGLSFAESRSKSTQHCHTKHHSAATDPELVQHCTNSSAYRFLCSHAGVFFCKMTNISFEMKGSGEVLYTVVSWDDNQLLGMDQFMPAGPLYNINCSEDSIRYLHLPHCEIPTGKNEFELSVAHFSEGNVEIIQPLNITSTHVIFEVHGLSIFGLLIKRWFFEKPINAQVLLFYNEKRKKLHIHLLPVNVSVEEVRKLNPSNTYIQCSSLCQLTPGKKYRPLCKPYSYQPKVETFGCDYGPNHHITFEVILNNKVEDLTLGLLDESGQEVWEPRRVFLTAESKEADPAEKDKGAEFVDKHRDILIQRVFLVLEIADTLLTKKLIRDELYNDIKEATTPQKKMRILYSCLDSGGKAVKAEFYKILKQKQPEIVNELDPRSNYA
ncbi:MORC family CW-type zinc finger protein 1-like isoform X2 [Tachysurus fulvidraco]|uniref:MORC family CW-type zinc finger protein 1-like isoform X2 n=1 Tax=Tachysurus fulvidraco TaxID=1234273 RepID=UPI001FEF5CC4|nr:MORC family CW-type zinc finger protein 1-like isoform X2 [Tachysurus fulvidraco]